ncbi:MAG: hypothetical protein KUG78_20815 [Kangiellaceae bacterium]|nr:hypothetical protein [Kangiellaceae bacterium]
MKKEMTRFVQQQLNNKGLNAGAVDGDAGNKTMTALAKIPEIPKSWSKRRKLTGFIQLLAIENNIEVGELDGYMGQQTEHAYELLQRKLVEKFPQYFWRPEELSNVNPNQWPSQQTNKELERFYGKVGENQTRIQLPYSHKLAWKTSTKVNSFLCHEKVHDSLLRVLTNVYQHYGDQQIKALRLDLWGGCLNVRRMRGGSRYSTHSWGIALDYDPSHNKLKWGRDKASFADPAYDSWWRFWEEEGWVSLGRTRNFDWMHIQAARL